jgi:glucosamine kinase
MWLGIDVGASSTKWAIWDGQDLLTGQSAPFGHLLSKKQREEHQGLKNLLEVTVPYGPKGVVAGITGLSTEAANWLALELVGAYALPPAQIHLMDDMQLAYKAHFAPGEGILVYSGTGSIAYHITTEGQVVRSGGYGYLIGDEGGGFWIGQQALRYLMHVYEQPVQDSLLVQMLHAEIGSTWPEIRQYVYAGGRTAVAKLAPIVAKAASDPTAGKILQQAGLELAHLAQNMQAKLGSLPVVLAGGISQTPEVVEGFRSRLEVRVSQVYAAEAAAKMAVTLK